MFSEIGYVVFLLLALPYIESASRRLSDYVEHYEPLQYDAHAIHAQHSRTRRSADAQELRIAFHAHGRRFHLRLRRDLSAFSRDFKVEGSNGEIHDVDTSHIYRGDLVVAGQGLCKRHIDQQLRYTERDKTPETANDVCCASAFHPQYPTAISPAPPPVGMPDSKNNAPPVSTASTNTHSNAETSPRECSEPTLMLDADRGEAVVADRQSVSVEEIIDRQDGGEQPESASVAPKHGPSSPHSDTEQSIPRCRYNLRPRKKKIVKL